MDGSNQGTVSRSPTGSQAYCTAGGIIGPHSSLTPTQRAQSKVTGHGVQGRCPFKCWQSQTQKQFCTPHAPPLPSGHHNKTFSLQPCLSTFCPNFRVRSLCIHLAKHFATKPFPCGPRSNTRSDPIPDSRSDSPYHCCVALVQQPEKTKNGLDMTPVDMQRNKLCPPQSTHSERLRRPHTPSCLNPCLQLYFAHPCQNP
jgi:hypothetical protein